jgi:hypothetical protein
MNSGFRVHDKSRSGAETTLTGPLTGPLSGPVEGRSRVRFSLPAQPWRVRLLGTLVAAVCAAASYALVMGLTGSLSHAGSASSPTVSDASSPAASGNSSHAAAAPTFSHLPRPCSLLSASIVAEYLPRTTCDSNISGIPGGSNAMWNSPTGSASGGYFVGDVEATLMPGNEIESTFDELKASTATMFSGETIRDSRPIAGLGDEAYIVFAASPVISGVGGEDSTYLIVADENALIDIDYDTTTIQGQAVPQTQAEAAALAMARDVIKGLR